MVEYDDDEPLEFISQIMIKRVVYTREFWKKYGADYKFLFEPWFNGYLLNSMQFRNYINIMDKYTQVFLTMVYSLKYKYTFIGIPSTVEITAQDFGFDNKKIGELRKLENSDEIVCEGEIANPKLIPLMFANPCTKLYLNNKGDQHVTYMLMVKFSVRFRLPKFNPDLILTDDKEVENQPHGEMGWIDREKVDKDEKHKKPFAI